MLPAKLSHYTVQGPGISSSLSLMTNSLTLIGSYDSIDSLQTWLQFIVEYIWFSLLTKPV